MGLNFLGSVGEKKERVGQFITNKRKKKKKKLELRQLIQGYEPGENWERESPGGPI